jgi:hypothetical protein
MEAEFQIDEALQQRTAWLAIGRSTLRKQGAPGMVKTARRFLARLDLAKFSVLKQATFDAVLEDETKRLMRRFPRPADRNWGAARKSLNIFLRDVFYSYRLRTSYGLSKIEPWLELPLDSYSYLGLCEDSSVCEKWLGVKGLTPPANSRLQGIADAVARQLKTFRVHLDLRYWRPWQK